MKPQMPDRKFVERAVADADVNVLRMALFQATRDPDIAAVHAERVAGMVADTVVFSDSDTDLIRSKAVEYLISGDLADEAQTPSQDEITDLIRMAEARDLASEDLFMRRQILSFPEWTFQRESTGETPVPEATRSRSSEPDSPVSRWACSSPDSASRSPSTNVARRSGECGASTLIPTSASTRSVRRTSTRSRRSTRGPSTSRASPRYVRTSTTSHASTVCTSTSSSTRR